MPRDLLSLLVPPSLRSAGTVLVATFALAQGALIQRADAQQSSVESLASEQTQCAIPSASELPSSRREALVCRVERTVLRETMGDATPLADLYRASQEGSPDERRRALNLLAVRVPVLRDRFELLLAELALSTRTPIDDASICALFEGPAQSPNHTVAARSAVGRVACLLELAAPSADEELAALRRQFPALPDTVRLELARAQAHEARNALTEAVELYRRIDLLYPEEGVAQTARERLSALSSEHPAAPWTAREAVERASRVVRRGTVDQAREALATIETLELPPVLAERRVTLQVLHLRNEGRIEEARVLERTILAETAPRVTPEEPTRALRTLGLRVAPVRRNAPTAEPQLLARGIASGHLVEATRISARAGLSSELAAIVESAASRRNLSCHVRSEIAIVASGTANDSQLVTLLAPCAEGRDVRSHYLLARALDRAGESERSRELYERVRVEDDANLGFYKLWADSRLAALETIEASPGDVSAPPAAPTGASPRAANDDEALLTDVDAAAALDSLAEEHGAAFPWLARAAAALRIGDRVAASDEIAEVYQAWNLAERNAGRRAGLEAVYRGRNLAGRAPAVAPSVRRARRGLDARSRQVIGRVALALGEAGLALRFGALDRNARPRPYADLVTAAAERHHIDPNLLFAVMRVESVYDPRVVSYAGAVGLLQIMPTTGDRIAARMGVADFGTDDLLNPATNIEFSAWYLHSLLERFEGRVPLAIAAYNGGPHNVRRWMAEHASTMSLDAFLERIPFDQTHRYVRRVLTHYAAYRQEAGLSLPELDQTLPGATDRQVRVDGVAF